MKEVRAEGARAWDGARARNRKGFGQGIVGQGIGRRLGQGIGRRLGRKGLGHGIGWG